MVLANSDYASHMTDEGEQFQRGLEAAGWTLAGFGFKDGCKDVPTLLHRHTPSVVVVQPREDWDVGSPGCFDKRVSFDGIAALAESDAYVVAVVKDAPGETDRQRRWCEEIHADAVLLYYHESSVRRFSPWIDNYQIARTYHTIDAGACCELVYASAGQSRKRAVVSGAVSHSYPIRRLVIENAANLGVERFTHPGYGNKGHRTREYLEMMAGYRVHVATSSRYKFALRKIVESVAVGCTPVTDLPEYDVLPGIDGALVRIASPGGVDEVRAAIERADSEWDEAKRIEWARLARTYYDWPLMADKLTTTLMGMAANGKQNRESA